MNLIMITNMCNTVLCMIMEDGKNKYVITCFRILNKILFKSNQTSRHFTKYVSFAFIYCTQSEHICELLSDALSSV